MAAARCWLLFALCACGASSTTVLDEYINRWPHKLTSSKEDYEISDWLHQRMLQLQQHNASVELQEYSIGAPLFLPRSCTVHLLDDVEPAVCYPIQPAPCRNETYLELQLHEIDFFGPDNVTESYELSNDGTTLRPSSPDTKLMVVNDDWTAVGQAYVATGFYNRSSFGDEAP